MIDTIDNSSVDQVCHLPRLRIRSPKPKSWQIVKRAMDVVISTLALIAASPIIVVAMIAIVASSPGWPIFAQERVGLYGRRFMMFKLRTMMSNADLHKEDLQGSNEISGPVFKMKSDPRVFPAGRFLRRTSIDELPNLFNVLLGQMSIVGPRPPLPNEVENYNEHAFQRLLVKPGVTCLWQISGRSNVDFDRWMELDHRYIANWSPLYDLQIMVMTIPAIVLAKGAY